MASEQALKKSIETIRSVFQKLAGKHEDPTTLSCYEFVTGMQAESQFAHMSVDELKVSQCTGCYGLASLHLHDERRLISAAIAVSNSRLVSGYKTCKSFCLIFNN